MEVWWLYMEKKFIFHEHTWFLETVMTLVACFRDKHFWKDPFWVLEKIWWTSSFQNIWAMIITEASARQAWKWKSNFWPACKGHGESSGWARGRHQTFSHGKIDTECLASQLPHNQHELSHNNRNRCFHFVNICQRNKGLIFQPLL